MCIFSAGEASVRVLNLRNGRVHCKELHLLERDGQGVGIQYVTMDKGVGVLLETEGFRQRISAEQLQECLKGKTWADNDSLGNSLQELVEQMGADDGGYMGAVLLVTK